MDNKIDNHILKMLDRNSLSITGIKKIIDFDDREFNIDSIMGVIKVNGSDLEIVKLDTIDGNIIIKGEIDSIVYDSIHKKSESIVTKLFK